MYPLHKLD